MSQKLEMAKRRISVDHNETQQLLQIAKEKSARTAEKRELRHRASLRTGIGSSMINPTTGKRIFGSVISKNG